MQLTGLILFIGALISFLYWGYGLFSIRKFIYKIPKEELLFEYSKGIALFIAIAISAGMVWGWNCD